MAKRRSKAKCAGIKSWKLGKSVYCAKKAGQKKPRCAKSRKAAIAKARRG